MSAAEEWRPIPGRPDYSVSDLGRVMSHKQKTPRILRPTLNTGGYPQVTLSNGRSGSRKFAVHRLVVAAFLGPRPEGMETRHLDGDKTNNALSNLVLGSHSENVRDQVEHGTHALARKTHCPRGHEYDERNTRWGSGKRVCRPCHRINVANYRTRQAFAAANVQLTDVAA